MEWLDRPFFKPEALWALPSGCILESPSFTAGSSFCRSKIFVCKPVASIPVFIQPVQLILGLDFSLSRLSYSKAQRQTLQVQKVRSLLESLLIIFLQEILFHWL